MWPTAAGCARASCGPHQGARVLCAAREARVATPRCARRSAWPRCWARAKTRLVCEELALRARLDLDQGRAAHAAVGLSGALDAALRELPAEQRPDLALRIAELQKLRHGVAMRARSALPGEQADEGSAAPEAGGGKPAGAAPDPPETAGRGDDKDLRRRAVDEEVIRHGLERLEAALRARTAAGFGRWASAGACYGPCNGAYEDRDRHVERRALHAFRRAA